MIRIISALILTMAASLANAASAPIQLSDNAPTQHVVVKGDTLWDISAQFLKEPWRWPEIWRMNRDKIKDPHWIYPGEVIVLDYDANGNPLLRKESGKNGKLQPKIYSEQVDQAIPPIPPNVIEPFISAPLVVEVGELDKAARIVATQQDRVFLGRGDVAYVDDADPAQQKWYVYRNGKPLLDPEDPKKILGYEAFYLGSAVQTKPGQPATFEIATATQEIGRGDRLMPATRPPLVAYVPHKPDANIDGRVVSVYGGVGAAGRGSIVSLNRGTSDGIEIGHVLALERNRVVAGRNEQDEKVSIQIPAERVGLVFVFRVFDRISYALVVQSEGTVGVNDFVRTP